MSSILTNNGAMVALQTLRGINRNLADTQNAIATGKDVSSAKDNAAVWAISKVMESDVSGFKAISDNLGLGQSTVAVARQAAETTTDLLKQMKEKIVASQESNVDRNKIQDDISALRNQIGSVVGAAQFNGLNLLSNAYEGGAAGYTATGFTDAQSAGEVNVLSSLDRSSTGVTTADITVVKQDLSTQAGSTGSLTLAAGAASGTGTAGANGSGSATYTINGETGTAGRTEAVMAGDSYSFEMSVFSAAVTGTPFAATDLATYTARDGDTQADIAAGLVQRINYQLAENDVQGFEVQVDPTNSNAFTIVNNNGTAMAAAGAGDFTLNAGGTSSGGLELLADIDVTTEEGARAGLIAIEGLIQTAIDSASAFGSAQTRIETQKDFVSGLTDALKSGIGTLVDADMEEASARLQALQVQQQLGVQALSIANQAPQQLLSLFR